MNINSFFLDKLSAGSQSLTSGTEKSSLSSYLFSDIIKVYEQENGIELKSQSDCENPLLNAMDNLPLTKGFIECNDIKLKTLSDFIESFIDNSNEPVNISESKTDLQPIVISKKKFLLSSDGMEKFLKGLAESININLSDELKATILSNTESKEEPKELSLNVKIDDKVIPLLEKELEKNNVKDLFLPESETVLLPFFNFLSENKSLSLSFKSNLERVSINFLELPEDNFETKINLEKLASDFSKEGKKIFNTEFEASNETLKEGIINSSITSLSENKQTESSLPSSETTDPLLIEDQKSASNLEQLLKPDNPNTQQNKNIYKTEIVEVSYRPDTLLNNMKTEASSKPRNGVVDPLILSGFSFDTPEISDAQFRLSNNLTMQLNIDASGEIDILGANPSMQSEGQKFNNLFKQYTLPVIKVNNTESRKELNREITSEKISEPVSTLDLKSSSVKMESHLNYDLLKNENSTEIIPDQAAAVESIEKQEAVIDTKVLVNELNGKLVGVEFKNSKVKNKVDVKSISGEVTTESKADVKDIQKRPFSEVEENILKENLKNKIQSFDQKSSEVEEIFITNESKEPIGKKIDFEFTKIKGNSESAKIITDDVNAKSVSGDSVNESKVNVKNAVNKIFAEIEYEKNKTMVKANDPLQETDMTVNNDELKDEKTLNNLLNGKLSGDEFKRAIGKNNTETENIRSVSGSLSKEDKVQVNREMNESSGGKDFTNANTGNSIKEISRTTDQITGMSGIENKKILFSELNAMSGGSDLKKTAGKEDKVKAINEDLSAKSASEESVKEKMVKETENKSSEGKDFSKHKSDDNFKNALQSTERISGNDTEKFKINPELKTSPEIPKTIKTHEIIPEFTKIIQSGEKQSMTFQLTPENLGKVKLVVELVENQISTRIEVENEQVKQFVQSNVEQLKQNLQSSGIQLSSVNISLTESEQKFSKGFTPRKKSGERVSKVKVEEEKTTPAQKSLGYNTYEFLA